MSVWTENAARFATTRGVWAAAVANDVLDRLDRRLATSRLLADGDRLPAMLSAVYTAGLQLQQLEEWGQ